jgi:paraquat-inducible protein A
MSANHDAASYPPGTAAAAGLACCHVCCKLSPVELHDCPLCGAALHLRMEGSVQKTLALLFTAVLLYIPANILPIMTTSQLGRPEDNTILGGVVLLMHHGSYPIALVIFVASVLVPTGKILAIGWLCWSVARRHTTSLEQRTQLYRVTEFIGKWSMTDVFVVAILVALIQLGGLLSITAGSAAIAFGGVVILTMLSAEAFDPRLIWDHTGWEPGPEAEQAAERQTGPEAERQTGPEMDTRHG